MTPIKIAKTAMKIVGILLMRGTFPPLHKSPLHGEHDMPMNENSVQLPQLARPPIPTIKYVALQ